MRRAPVICLLVAFALTACSGKVTRESFIAEADAQCRQINERFKTIPAPTSASTTSEYLQRSLTISENGATGLRSVAAPPELKPMYAQLLLSIDRANQGLREALAASKRNDEAALGTAAKKIAAAQKRFKSYAEKLGLLVCVDAGATP
jgi:hypothetical protein